MQLPMFYEFDCDFSVFPGIVDTDQYHQINLQVLYHGNGEEIFIKRGTPLAQFIPFKRESFSMQVRGMSKKDLERFSKVDMSILTLFPNRHAYKRL